MRTREHTAATFVLADRRLLEELVGRLASVDDGLVTHSRRELVAMLRDRLEEQERLRQRMLLAGVPGQRFLYYVRRYFAALGRLGRALDDIEITSPRHVGYTGAVAEARAAIAALFDEAVVPLESIAERRRQIAVASRPAPAADRGETAPLELPTAA